ncbi:hypothetical protein, partial [Alcanivorax sp.]|uniref:hypothetical protein n=1 Tax=Alcanivorax sp. TaxID=1872427 RepID=UPI00258616DB
GVVSSPAVNDSPYQFQVYLNGVLQQVRTLENDGKKHFVRVELSERDRKPAYNRLDFVVQRVRKEGRCVGVLSAMPVQITPDSYIELKPVKGGIKAFRQLRPLFSSGVDVYLPYERGKRAQDTLAFTAALFSANDYPLQPGHIHFYSPGRSLNPKGPFVVIGRPQLQGIQAGVRFDRGRMRVVDDHDRVLLSSDTVKRVTVLQVAKANGQKGLWVRPGVDGLKAPDRPLVLDEDTVAFADAHGVLLTLDTNTPEVSQVDYLDYQNWFELLGRYRFWLLALGWVLLAVVVVYLLLKAREYRKVELK